MNNTRTLRQSLAQLRDKRFAVIFLLGFSSGFPWVLHGSVMTLWLQSLGLSRSAIGFFGAVATVYAINWMWAPLVDRFAVDVSLHAGCFCRGPLASAHSQLDSPCEIVDEVPNVDHAARIVQRLAVDWQARMTRGPEHS